ncbi:hypothetical protein AURDEDRAFT_161018 [Auricularia subglabra TFB-10046 SS5]|nr:hypothetical protein AURDEDRAFT_161018 [Auricularia subglabra TFB-10046 SS5]
MRGMNQVPEGKNIWEERVRKTAGAGRSCKTTNADDGADVTGRLHEIVAEPPERPRDPGRRARKRQVHACMRVADADADADMRHLRAAVRQT